ncbi:MAG: hypothetical protein IJ794_00265 [Lachnospiraceae bacterium]|nr:hypothetical protein [Lachnospiraceae bacterium]
MSIEDKLIETQNMTQEMRGLAQLSKMMSIQSGLSESDMDDIWYIVYGLAHKWQNTMTSILEDIQ